MKVALSFPGCHRRGGVERVVYECASHLSARSHDVHLLAHDWQSDVESFAHCHRIRCAARPGFLKGRSYFQNCTRFLGTLDYDVLATHGVVCPTGGILWVQSLHAAWLERSRKIRPPLSAARLKQRVNPLHPIILGLEQRHFRARAYKKLIATTGQVQQDLHHFYDVPLEDVVIIPNGFNPDEFSPGNRLERRREMRQRLRLRDDQVVLLFVANELERKGYRTLLGALRILGRRDLRLLVVGKPKVATVGQWAARQGVSDQVLPCGSSSDVAAYHAAADLFVLPTQYEAFSLAILEALGSGLPVVTSRIPGAADAVRAGINGELVADPSSADELAATLAPLLSHDMLGQYSRRTAQTVALFQWPIILQRYESVLKQYANV